jgi:murein DD-endopeptidase MepM/ murein hydrolase activator NlpD
LTLIYNDVSLKPEKALLNMKQLFSILTCFLFTGTVSALVFTAEEKNDIRATIERSVDITLEKSANNPEQQKHALQVYHRLNLFIDKDIDPKGVLIGALDYFTDETEVPIGNLGLYLSRVVENEESTIYSHLTAMAQQFLANNEMVPDSITRKIVFFQEQCVQQECARIQKQLITLLEELEEPFVLDSTTVLVYFGKQNPLVSVTEGKIISTYKMRFHPILKKWRWHHGVDFGSKSNSPVKSAFNGTVTASGYSKTAGNYVKVFNEQTGITQKVDHLSKILVSKGGYVHAGDIIGKCGSTGELCKGPHVHLEFLYGTKSLDPQLVYRLAYISGGLMIREKITKHSNYEVCADCFIDETYISILEQKKVARATLSASR